MVHIDVPASELIAHVAELQRKASAYDELLDELTHLRDHFLALGLSYEKSASKHHDDPENRAAWEAKASSYHVAAGKIHDILASEA